MKLYIAILAVLAFTGCCLASHNSRTNNNNNNNTPKDRVEQSNTVCDDCKVVVGMLDTALHDAEKLEEIKGVLKMLCDYLAGDEVQECKNMIDNLDALINRIEPFLRDPERACEAMGMCGSQSRYVPRKVRVLTLYARHMLTRERNDVLCDECQFVMNELKALMQDKETQSEAKQALDYLCNEILSGATAQKCQQIVDQYFSVLWDELEALLSDTHQICVDLEMCQTRRQPTGLRGTPLIRLLPAMRRSIVHGRLPQRQTPRLDSTTRFLRRIQTQSGLNAGCVLCKIGLTGIIDYLKDGPMLKSPPT